MSVAARPWLLDQCDYQTFSLYPFYGSFLGSRAFQTTTGISHYLDMRDLGTRDFEADSFYFDRAVDLIERERRNGPLFLYVYDCGESFSPGKRSLRPGADLPIGATLATLLMSTNTFVGRP